MEQSFSRSEEWLAKSEPTHVVLEKHLEDAWKNSCMLSKTLKLSSEIAAGAQFAAAFHDFGKCDRRFQCRVRKQPSERVSHALLSLSAAKPAADIFFSDEDIKRAVLWAIACHHSPPHDKLFGNQKDAYSKLDADNERALKLAMRICNWLGVPKKLGLETNVRSLWRTLLDDQILFSKKQPDDISNFRNIFVQIQGVLQISDYNASGAQINPCPTFDLRNPLDVLSTPYAYQLNAAKLNGNAMARLPTGGGKTETALVWARYNTQHRLFYVLPTQATLNAMRIRLLRLIEKEGVALVHSGADAIEYSEQEEDGQDVDFDSFNASRWMSKMFSPPVVLCTPDQLILTLYNHGKYAPRCLMLGGASIVIDEIHSYDPMLFLRTIDALKILSRPPYSCKVFFMSATLPEPLRRELSFLNACSPATPEQEEKVFSEKIRTKPILKDCNIDSQLGNAITQVKEGKRVLMIANTVNTAQELYRKSKDELNEKTILFHARFTQEDKRKKEKQVQDSNDIDTRKPHLLIATQVVEVSLDVDYQHLYTEVAPLDSLVQRLGRLNRKGSREAIEAIICLKRQTTKPYHAGLVSETVAVLKEHIDKYSNEWDYVTWNEEYYRRIWEPIVKAKLMPQTADLLSTQNENNYWKKKSGIFKLRLNEQEATSKIRGGFDSVLVLPEEYFEDAKAQFSSNQTKKEKFESYLWLSDHLVTCPIWSLGSSSLRDVGSTGLKTRVWLGKYDSISGLLPTGHSESYII